MSPLVTVVIPTFNRRGYVHEAIDSVFQQTYTDYEIIVVDDGSADGTGTLLQERYGDRITYIWQENQGESAARNRGIQQASGRYIALLDSDDLWLPQKLEVQLSAITEDPRIGVVCTQAWVIAGAGNRWDEAPLGHENTATDFEFNRLCLSNPVINSTALFTAHAFEVAGGYDPKIRFGEDWDLWLRITKAYRIEFIPEPLAHFRVHGGSQSQLNSKFDAQLHDHLYLIHKSFEQRVLDAELAALRERAVAWRYVKAFVAAGIIGQIAPATDYLDRALQHAPALYNDPQFVESILASAGSFVANVERPDYAQADEFVEQALAIMSSLKALPTAMRRRILTETYMLLAYAARKHRNLAVCHHFYRKAIRTNPTVVARRGVLAGLVDTGGAGFGGLQQFDSNEHKSG